MLAVGERICSVEDCEGRTGIPGTARGWCKKHYMRWKRTGSVNLNTSPTPCKDCEAPVARAGNGNSIPRCPACRRRARSEYALRHDHANPVTAAARRRRNRPTREVARRIKAASYERHRESILARRQAKYWADPEPIRQQGREWARLHRDQIKANNKRYLELIEAGSIGPPIHRPTIYERDGWICQLCFAPVDPDVRWPDPWSASLDHVIPLSVKPLHVPDNVRLTHLRCNQRRGNKI